MFCEEWVLAIEVLHVNISTFWITDLWGEEGCCSWWGNRVIIVQRSVAVSWWDFSNPLLSGSLAWKTSRSSDSCLERIILEIESWMHFLASLLPYCTHVSPNVRWLHPLFLSEPELWRYILFNSSYSIWWLLGKYISLSFAHELIKRRELTSIAFQWIFGRISLIFRFNLHP